MHKSQIYSLLNSDSLGSIENPFCFSIETATFAFFSQKVKIKSIYFYFSFAWTCLKIGKQSTGHNQGLKLLNFIPFFPQKF